MFAYSTHGDGECPLFESVSIDAKAKVSGQGDEKGIFPVFAQGGTPLHDLASALFKTFQCEGSHPIMDQECGQGAYHIATARIEVVAVEFGIILLHILWHGKLQLRNFPSIGIEQRHVHLGSHMKNDVLVSLIALMVMTKPVAGFHMQFYTPHPFRSVQFYFGVHKVRPRVGVVKTRVEHFHRAAIGGAQLSERKNLVFPHVVKQLFHVFVLNFVKGKE